MQWTNVWKERTLGVEHISFRRVYGTTLRHAQCTLKVGHEKLREGSNAHFYFLLHSFYG